MSQTSTTSNATPTCVQVHYQVTGDREAYRAFAGAAAPHLAHVPGLRWKLWLFDEPSGEAAGIYLFADDATASAFLEGPTLEGLRQHPGIARVVARRLGVVTELSLATFGHRAGL
jgi:hypothetical protein